MLNHYQNWPKLCSPISLFFVDVINEITISKLASKALQTILPKVSENNCFIVKNKYLIPTRSCFVLVTIIRDEVDIEGNIMLQNMGKQILHSLPKDESKRFSNQWYIA